MRLYPFLVVFYLFVSTAFGQLDHRSINKISNRVGRVVLNNGHGSCYVFDKDGYDFALTNYHVVRTDDGGLITKCTIEMTINGVIIELKATPVWADSGVDIALLLIQKTKFIANEPSICPDDVVIGEELYTICNPGPDFNSFIRYYISNPSRILDGHRMMQLHGVISPGASGGAIFNEDLELVGLMRLQSTVTPNIAFCLSPTEIRKVLKVKDKWILDNESIPDERKKDYDRILQRQGLR